MPIAPGAGAKTVPMGVPNLKLHRTFAPSSRSVSVAAEAKNTFVPPRCSSGELFFAAKVIRSPVRWNLFLTSRAFARKTALASLFRVRVCIAGRAIRGTLAAPRGEWFTERMRAGPDGNAVPETGLTDTFPYGASLVTKVTSSAPFLFFQRIVG